MDVGDNSIYKQQLLHVNQALATCPDGPERQELLNLKANIEELLSLTNDEEHNPSTSSDDPLADEFALFMAEMEKDGAVHKNNQDANNQQLEELKNIEGMKCRAPHKHQWGHVAYHNAMICSMVTDDLDCNEIKVRVLFTNPTHREMLPCPYYYESDCKFSEEKCRFSHGEIVPYSSLQEYIEPKFDRLEKGCSVLAKQSDNLWHRGIIRRIYEEKCLIKFELDKKVVEVELQHIFPLTNEDGQISNASSEEEDEKVVTEEDVINTSLMAIPPGQAMGSWEKYTKGIGSKLMQKMGYITGSGLGKNAEGRIDPVSAVVLPAGKSLDHCMKLREQAGGDKDLFSVERKLKRMQRKQEIQNQKAYEKALKDGNVFNFINKTLSNDSKDKQEDGFERQKLKKECSRSLNIRSLQVADNIKRAERDLEKLRDSLGRHTDVTSNIHLKLKDKLVYRQDQLKMYQAQAVMIRNEQSLRNDKKKMTIF